jgi:hypothetical protein
VVFSAAATAAFAFALSAPLPLDEVPLVEAALEELPPTVLLLDELLPHPAAKTSANSATAMIAKRGL